MSASRLAGAVALACGLGVLVGGLTTGHSARSEAPPDLSAGTTGAAVGPWKAAALLVTAGPAVAVLDVRAADAFSAAHVPGARSLPGADADAVVRAGRGGAVLLVADEDAAAQRLVAEVRTRAPAAPVHYLAEGVRGWYLAFDLPVPLFAVEPVPPGYREALATARSALADPVAADGEAALEAIRTLARLDYRPSRLGTKRAAGAKRKRKKIAGGCG